MTTGATPNLPTGPGEAPATKGLGPLTWVLIFGAVVLVGIAAMAAIGGYLSLDTRSDVGAELNDVTIRTPDGDVLRAGSGDPVTVPAWVGLYPGATAPREAASMATQTDLETVTFQVTTEDMPDQVIAYYQDLLESEGHEVQVTRTPAFSVLEGTIEAPWRRLSVLMAVGDDDLTTLVFQCQER